MENELSCYFDSEQLIITNFILYTYIPNGIIGTTLDRKTISIYLKTGNSLNYVLDFQYILPYKVYNICLFDVSNDKISFLVTFYEKGTFINRVLIEDELLGLEDTVAAPMIISNGKLKPGLLMQTKDGTFIFNVKYSRQIQATSRRIKFDDQYFVKDLEVTKKKVEIKQLKPEHTSGYIDLDNDSINELVLETQNNGKNYLSIYKKQGDEIIFHREFLLPNRIGSLQFGDFSQNHLVDLAFLSEENGNYFLNIWYNNEILFEKRAKLHLNNTLKEFRPSFSKTSLRTVDIFNDSNLHLIIIFENNSSKPVLFKNDGAGNFEPKLEIFQDLEYKHLTSISFSDLNLTGKEGLIINYFEDGKQKLVFRRNLLEGDLYFSAIAFEKSGKFPLPGVSYNYFRMEDSQIRGGHQLIYSTYPHLTHPHVFFGLGGSPFLIELSKVVVPEYKITSAKTFKMFQKIIPNSNLILQIDKEIEMKLNLNAGAQKKTICIFMAIVLVLNLFLLMVFHLREKKKKKMGGEVLFNLNSI